jgi:hypothetical protein
VWWASTATRSWAGRPAPMPTVWTWMTSGAELSAWRLGGLARPVRIGRSALREGGGGRGVVCLAPSRQAAKRLGVWWASTATWSWAGRPAPMPTVWTWVTSGAELSAWRLGGLARPVRIGRSALREAGGGRGVVCLAPSRQAAKRLGVWWASTATWSWAGRPAPMPTVWTWMTSGAELSAWRLGGLARPVRIGRSALREGGGGRGVVCLAPSRQAAKRLGVWWASTATRSWAGCPAPMATVWTWMTSGAELSAWRLGGLARPVLIGRSALREAGGGRGVVLSRAKPRPPRRAPPTLRTSARRDPVGASARSATEAPGRTRR